MCARLDIQFGQVASRTNDQTCMLLSLHNPEARVAGRASEPHHTLCSNQSPEKAPLPYLAAMQPGRAARAACVSTWLGESYTGLACQTLPGLPRAARPSGRFAEGKTPLNMRQGLANVYVA